MDDFFQKQGIGQNDRVVVVIPGALFGPSKCWCRILCPGCRCADPDLPGKGADSARAGRASCSKEDQGRHGGDSYRDGDTIVPLNILMALISRSTILISNDTGPRYSWGGPLTSRSL